jgi:hypothetical protein
VRYPSRPTGKRSRVAEPENPFRIGGVVSGKHFTNRAAERRRIRRALTEPQDHLLVFGPRRMGKSSTLRVVQDDLAAHGKHVVAADLSTASSLTDLTNRVLQAAQASLGRVWHDVLTSLVQGVSVRVGVAMDPGGTPLPSVDVSLRGANLDAQRATFGSALDAIERLAATRRAHIGVILDEFQEIHRFGGETAEAHLRGIIQNHRHVSYVLAGSDEGLIRAMIGPRRPLYKLLEPLAFGPIEPAHLARWVDERMRSAGVEARGVGEAIVALAGPRTRDVVQLARATFEVSRRFGTAAPEHVAEGFRQIVLSEDAPIRAQWAELSPLQQNVLRAASVFAAGLTTGGVRRQFGLGDTGPASKAAGTLVARSLLVKAAGGYLYDNPFVRGWVIANALADAGVAVPITHVPALSQPKG